MPKNYTRSSLEREVREETHQFLAPILHPPPEIVFAFALKSRVLKEQVLKRVQFPQLYLICFQ